MNVSLTTCDHCGKVHSTPFRSVFQGGTLLGVALIVDNKTAYLDFCNEDCLRAELIKRKDAKDANP